MKKSQVFLSACLFVLSYAVFAQDITTANMFFSAVSQKYGTVRDYTARVTIDTGGTESTGTVFFKRPGRMRIDFSQPAEQTIVYTGDTLIIYLPSSQAVLTQTVAGSSGATLATQEGLALMRRSFAIAYETGADPVPLEQDSPEMVVVLSLNRRSVSEAFRTIRLSIYPDSKLIRRVEAWPVSGSKITFDFTEYAINTDIPDDRFLYNPPSAANMKNNFLLLD